MFATFSPMLIASGKDLPAGLLDTSKFAPQRLESKLELVVDYIKLGTQEEEKVKDCTYPA